MSTFLQTVSANQHFPVKQYSIEKFAFHLNAALTLQYKSIWTLSVPPLYNYSACLPMLFSQFAEFKIKTKCTQVLQPVYSTFGSSLSLLLTCLIQCFAWTNSTKLEFSSCSSKVPSFSIPVVYYLLTVLPLHSLYWIKIPAVLSRLAR